VLPLAAKGKTMNSKSKSKTPVAAATTCSVCHGLGYYETWKHDYGTEVRKHKCPCKIPNYVQPDCPLLGIEYEKNLTQNTPDQERKSPASDGFKFNNPNEL
jgi:hypothetical protein